ncbi:bifunctional protein FolD [Sesbania bispinosa]|nr:bifunctional protein FolD [Sesbania bispinosa]
MNGDGQTTTDSEQRRKEIDLAASYTDLAAVSGGKRPMLAAVRVMHNGERRRKKDNTFNKEEERGRGRRPVVKV